MSQNRTLTRDEEEDAIKVDPFHYSQMTPEITYASKDRLRCAKTNSALVIFSALLVMFWIAFIFLAYVFFHPQDFVSLKLLKIDQYPPPKPPPPIGQNPSLFKPKNEVKCEHDVYLTDFRSDEIFQSIWISSVYCFTGILASASALYGVLINNPYFLDFWAYFLFLYGWHKFFVAASLFVFKCPNIFFLKHVVLADPSLILLSFLEVKISMKLILLMLTVVTFCVLMCLTKFRNHMVRENLKNEKMSERFRVA